MCDFCRGEDEAILEQKRDIALRHYYHCLVHIQLQTARQAFMAVCAAYKMENPGTPDWEIPEQVAMVLNLELKI